MRTVLIISPHFPPINAPDMQRVRMSLPYLADFGWQAVVLAVAPDFVEGVGEPLLLETVPADIPVCRVRALPARLTRKVGLGSLALRALPFLYGAGLKLIRQHNIDLVYFSTTMFPVLVLGRAWKRLRGVPYVVDMQDPWLSDYYDSHPQAERPPKYRLARMMHRVLEPWTMKRVDGLIAVSTAYIETLVGRYPWLAGKPTCTLPFAAAGTDFEVLQHKPQANPFFLPDDGQIHGLYVGRGGDDIAHALRILFRAFQMGLRQAPELFGRVCLHFIGTSYAPDERARPSVTPVAAEFGLGQQVREEPQRVPYFQALQLLLEADFLLVPGSDDPQYTASKLYPYIMARKPLLALFHAQSSMVALLEQTRAGIVHTFSPNGTMVAQAELVFRDWRQLLGQLPFTPQTDWAAFAPYTAREMTRQQCHLFDQVLEAI